MDSGSGIAKDKAYKYAIVAKADGARSSAPAIATLAASTAAPSTVPALAAAHRADDHQVYITWPATDGQTYRLERATWDTTASAVSSAYVDVPIPDGSLVNGQYTVVDNSVTYWSSYQYRLAATQDGITAYSTNGAGNRLTTDPFVASVPITIVAAQPANTVYAIDVTVTRPISTVYEDLTVELYHAEADSGNPANREGDWVPISAGPFTLSPNNGAVPTFKFTDTGLRPDVQYVYRADILVGGTRLKTTAGGGSTLSNYPQTAYSTLDGLGGATFFTSTGSTVTLQLAYNAGNPIKGTYPLLNGAKLYTFNANGTPRELGTIGYWDSATAANPTINQHSYYVTLDADDVNALKSLGTTTYSFVTENTAATPRGALRATTGAGNISLAPLNPVITALSGGVTLQKSSDTPASKGSIQFAGTAATADNIVVGTKVYYGVGGGNTEFAELGTVAHTTTAIPATDSTAGPIALNSYYVNIDPAVWDDLKDLGAGRTLYIQNLQTVPGSSGTLSDYYVSLGPVTF
jgi:hypothetical protein